MKLTLVIFLEYALIELFILFWIRLRIIGYIVKQKHLKTKYYKTAFKDYNIVWVTEFLLINNNGKISENISNNSIDNSLFSIFIY